MPRPELLILIPCHGLEDFPTDLGEADAAGLLNAFAAAYHPALIAATHELPAWRRADDPPNEPVGKIIIVPACCKSWLPHGWSESAAEAGAAVIEGVSDRQELVAALLDGLRSLASDAASGGRRSPEEAKHETRSTKSETNSKLETPNASEGERLEHSDLGLVSDFELRASDSLITPGADTPGSPIDAELVADFLAFGSAFLQVDLLTRRMHYYSNLDSGPTRLELIGAAEAAIAGDGEQARRRLNRAFEILLDARERFFPVDAYLIDLCLLIPRLAEKLPAALSPLEPTTLLATAANWEQIASEHPDLIERLKADWDNRRVCLAGGEYREGPTSLLPIESVLWEFDRGLSAYRRLFGRAPQVWARRRYGFSTLLPQILDRARLPFAVHAGLDDGYYPDNEHSKFRWDGSDGVGVDAFSRIPLAADSATSFLRFSQRLAESMEEDQAAAIMFARWPAVSTPWFEDLRRIHRYAPVFGKFVTLEAFFEDTDPPGRVHQHSAKDYFPPYLTQAVARDEADPVSRIGNAIVRRHRYDAVACLTTISSLVRGSAEGNDAANDLESALTDFEATSDAIDQTLSSETQRAAGVVAHALSAVTGNSRGVLVINPLSFPRRTTIDLPAQFSPPAIDGPVQHVQFDGTRRSVTLDIASAGFVWIADRSEATPSKLDEPPTADEGVLRNEFFEVHLSETTGGIAYIKGYGRKPKRLSQQLAFRFPRKRKLADGAFGDESSYYSEMRGRSIELTCTGPALAEAVTTGELVDQTNGELLARFRQTIRVWRGRPNVELEIELDPTRLPEGDPWSCYYACRFAWNDETAVVTRSVQQSAQPTPTGRFDAAHFIEIAEDDLRTTIVPVGLPFHRRIGDRRLDTLLVVAGETRRTFRFVIACDEPYPMRTALDAYSPPIVVETDHGPPLSGPTGWFLHVDAKNVQVTSLRPLPASDDQAAGVRVRLMETEGRARKTRLTFFKTPSSARLVNLVGESIGTASIEGDAVLVDLHKYEIATVELRF